MKQFFTFLFALSLLANFQDAFSQSTDSTQKPTSFSGSVALTTNGFSIIPTFSLNKPAVLISMSVRRNRLSFEPDIRMVPDATKGSMLFWLRYRLVDQKKFTFRLGGHPAFTLIRRTDEENGSTKEITEMLRFLAFEAVPGYKFNKHLAVSAMYLQGHGMQNHGPQLTRVLFLNTDITNLPLSQKLSFNLFPSVYFLNTDGYRGDYFTITGELLHKNIPFSVKSTINQTFSSNVPGNKEFMWNVTLSYNFNKLYRKVG